MSLQTSKIKKLILFKQKKKLLSWVFDLIHLGHVYHLKHQSFGDCLIVSHLINILKKVLKALLKSFKKLHFKELKVVDEVY